MSLLGLIALTSLVLLQAVYSEQSASITKLSPCACEYNGHVYNLSSLAMKTGARFKASVKGYTYSYNPCIPFTKDLSLACKNVAICYWSDVGPMSEAIGYQSSVNCQVNKGIVELIFKQFGTRLGMISTIQLKCNQSKIRKDDVGMTVDDGAEPIIQVEHKCCCPDGCPTKIVPKPTIAPIIPTVPASSVAPTTSSKTYVWQILVGVIGSIALVLLPIAYYCRRRVRIDNNQLIVPPIDNDDNKDNNGFLNGAGVGGREGIEHEEEEVPNRPYDYGAMRNRDNDRPMVPPMGNDDDDDDLINGAGEGSREGIEHEEGEVPHRPPDTVNSYLGVPEEGFTNPTQVSDQDPESHCCSEDHPFPASFRREPAENCLKV